MITFEPVLRETDVFTVLYIVPRNLEDVYVNVKRWWGSTSFQDGGVSCTEQVHPTIPCSKKNKEHQLITVNNPFTNSECKN